MSPPDDTVASAPQRGPRGGRSTVSKDGTMVRKTYYLDWAISAHLEEEAHRRHLHEAQLLREILRDYFGIE